MEQHSLIETMAITVLAALLGLSLPLIMQIIERLDSKYGSAVISGAFRREWVYRWYFAFVWLTIAGVLYLPFAFKAPAEMADNWWVCNSAHIAVWFMLAVTLVLLLLVSRKITQYEVPDMLLRKLAGNLDAEHANSRSSDRRIAALISDDEKGRRRFEEFGAVMKYSMVSGNTRLYLDCNTAFGYCIGICNREVGDGEAVEYTDGIYTLINETVRICQRFYDELLYPSLNNPYICLTAYFNSFGRSTISQKSLNQLWMNLRQLISCDKPEWVKGYWVYASQYADYTMAGRCHDASMPAALRGKYLDESRRVREFHHILLAYLLYLGKQDLVVWAFGYAPSSLRTQWLIPASISEVLEEMAGVDAIGSGMLLEQRYSFFSEQGIDTGNMMYGWLLKLYVAALNSRDLDYHNGLRSRSPWNFSVDADHMEMRYLYAVMSRVTSMRQMLYPNLEYFSSIGIDLDRLKVIDQQLKEVWGSIRKKQDDLMRVAHVDATDQQLAQAELKKRKDEILDDIPRFGNAGSGDVKFDSMDMNLIQDAVADKKDFVWNADSYCRDCVDGMLLGLRMQVREMYLRLFLMQTARATFFVDFDEVDGALRKLGIPHRNPRLAILPLNTSFRSDEWEVMAPIFGAWRQEILIMPRAMVPYAETADGSVSLLEKTHDDANRVGLRSDVKVRFLTPERLDYIRLVVINSLVDGRKSQLESIGNIDNYLVVGN